MYLCAACQIQSSFKPIKSEGTATLNIAQQLCTFQCFLNWFALYCFVHLSFIFPSFTQTADTTRPRRSQESDGVEYTFISKHLFETDVQNNKYVNKILSRTVVKTMALI